VSTLTLLECAVVTVTALQIVTLKQMVLVHVPVTLTTMVQVVKLVSLAMASQPMIQVFALHKVYALVHNTITVQVFANATSSTMVPIALHH
jgi:PleD family two-component response regulator